MMLTRRDFIKSTFLLPLAFTLGFSNKKTIYLTIDDGPKKNMELILDNIKDDNRLTFFLVGTNLKSPKDYSLAKRALAEGHTIANHSYSHPYFSMISFDKVKEEIDKTQDLIEKLYISEGLEPKRYFRFPYGDPGFYINIKLGTIYGSISHRNQIKKYLNDNHFTEYRWDVDSKDYLYYTKSKPIEEIINRLSKLENNSIVLCHDNAITSKHIIPYSQKYYELKEL